MRRKAVLKLCVLSCCTCVVLVLLSAYKKPVASQAQHNDVIGLDGMKASRGLAASLRTQPISKNLDGSRGTPGKAGETYLGTGDKYLHRLGDANIAEILLNNNIEGSHDVKPNGINAYGGNQGDPFPYDKRDDDADGDKMELKRQEPEAERDDENRAAAGPQPAAPDIKAAPPKKPAPLPPGRLRKRVRVIRKTMRHGKVIHEEVIGMKTVITNENGTTVKVEDKQSYDEIWYSDILNGNFKADIIRLNNKTREGPYLTEKLWKFQDTNSERLFLYNRLLQHGWKKNVTNLHHLRQELDDKGVDASRKLVITQRNSPVGSRLPFYISSKVFINNKAEKVEYLNVTRKLFKQLPETSPFRHGKYQRCAVIGNSGSLLNSGCGPEIDSYDMIFRCNAAPIVRYAHDAGWKSNLTTFNPSIFYRRFNALKNPEDHLNFRKNITQYQGYIWLPCFGSAALHNVCLTPVLSEVPRKPSEPQLLVAHPNQFQNFWNFWKERNTTKTPSTGFFMTHAALQLCDETHLYGFWPFPLRLDSQFERVPYHYFDDIVVSKKHGMSDEFSVFLQYHELGILRLHTGKCQEGKT